MKKKQLLIITSALMMASMNPAAAIAAPTTAVENTEELSSKENAEASVETSEEKPSSESEKETEPETAEVAPENETEAPTAVLSEDQVSAGYTIVDGKVIAPTQAGVTHYGGVENGQDTGFVTFMATVPEDVHGNAYLTMINLHTYSTYQVVMYEANKFVQTISLPAGRYLIDESGLLNDADGKYYAITKEFTVRRASNEVVTVDVHDSQKENESVSESLRESRAEIESVKQAMTAEETSIGPDGIPVEIGTTTTAAPAEYETSNGGLLPAAHKKMNLANIIFAFIFLLIPLCGCMIYLRGGSGKKKKKHSKDMDEF